MKQGAPDPDPECIGDLEIPKKIIHKDIYTPFKFWVDTVKLGISGG